MLDLGFIEGRSRVRQKISSVSFRVSSSIVSQISTFSSPNFKLKQLPQASTEAIPDELIEEEESKFVPLNADKIVFGPTGMQGKVLSFIMLTAIPLLAGFRLILAVREA